MPSDNHDCPKCRSTMERGFIPDFAHGPYGRMLPHWVIGVAKKSFWTGTQLPPTKAIPIAVFRCKSCGFLESYARDEFELQ